MSFEFLQAVALWCTLSGSSGYTTTINRCREKALECAKAATSKEQVECISKVEIIVY